MKSTKIIIVGSTGSGKSSAKEIDFPIEAAEKLLKEIANIGIAKKEIPEVPEANDLSGILSDEMTEELDTVEGKYISVSEQVANVAAMDDDKFDVYKAGKLAQRVAKVRMEAIAALGHLKAELVEAGMFMDEDSKEMIGELVEVINDYTSMNTDLEARLAAYLGIEDLVAFDDEGDFDEDEGEESEDEGNAEATEESAAEEPSEAENPEIDEEARAVLGRITEMRAELDELAAGFGK